ncbi:hypothetical protein KC19_7G104100 [Ceratodon purpureus]|uniref:Uncharacterized protein n=1 Tax=Ceratodon purpureus TaxID=3225 RepID=A0A8T0H4S8_CERPU|nr:hypothetical protein KC19_7G104100 [Ceratodon purpureus]
MGFLCSKFYYGDEDLSGRLRGIGACSEVSKTITVAINEEFDTRVSKCSVTAL